LAGDDSGEASVAPDDIVELFSAFGPVTVRRMFGGAGIYADDTMFGLIADGVIYLKTGESNAAMFERERLAPFTFSKRTGERVVTSYRRMPDRLYDDPNELVVWARAALAVAQQPKPRKRPAAKKAKVLRARPSRAKPKRVKAKRAKKVPARKGKKRRAR
jgi:DNA transformation protein and related proteins